MRDLRTRRTLRSCIAIVAVVAGSAVVVSEASALVRAAAVPDPPPGAAFELSDDDSGAALFTASGLRPGAPVSNCISIAHNTVSGDEPLQLRLHGASSGLLADRLRVDVEAGSGAAYGDCSTFAGQLVYSGTLGAFVADHADATTGVAVPAPGASGSVAFRFTATVLDDNQAQGASVNATFTWDAEVAPPPTVPPTVPATVPPATPATQEAPQATATTPSAPLAGAPATEPAPVPAGQPTTAAPVPPPAPGQGVARGRVTTTAPTAPKPAVPSTGGTGWPQPVDAGPATNPATDAAATGAATGPAAGVTSSLRPVGGSGRRGSPSEDGLLPSFDLTWRVLTQVGAKASFPLLLIVVLLIFLWVQDRIDRRDPKLALAPVHADPDLHFAPLAGGRA